jgi:hypothetical protein
MDDEKEEFSPPPAGEEVDGNGGADEAGDCDYDYDGEDDGAEEFAPVRAFVSDVCWVRRGVPKAVPDRIEVFAAV